MFNEEGTFYYTQEFMYVSTISDIAMPLRVRTHPGHYTFNLVHGRRGFQFGLAHKTLVNKEMLKLYSPQSWEAEVDNACYAGDIRNTALVNIICDNFLKDMPNELLYSLFCRNENVGVKVDFNNLHASFELIEQKLQQKYASIDVNAYFRKNGFNMYNNLPLLLFLNTIVPETDFDKLTFTAHSRFDGDGHWFRPYRVQLDDAFIGALVQTNEFYTMNGKQMGLAAYSEDRLHVQTFANFEPQTQEEKDKISVCQY
ncbi:hypothetical protein [Choristoneura rosaceana nucleopolyhedrovirus]|uniref:Uncharacterized protein n=1 Tax=Choristoneura rosaceana nucleopolyhedrovirus TaxID=58094 RepID=S5MKS3_9ABAC|nr:hypothetical protein [Choristoneura rosaceana nucleopolyhedrovirus]AGR57056.1 hypothetical protein [Choristoneura rosaceana nucleopolyhedrovirus]